MRYTKYNSTRTNGIFITTHKYDSVHFATLFNINIYDAKQSKKAITDMDESKCEISSIVAALVIDIYQRTQTEKKLFLSNTARKQPLKKFSKQRFLGLRSLTYINNKVSMTLKISQFALLIPCCCCCRFCLFCKDEYQI